jgi:hypothetical protein
MRETRARAAVVSLLWAALLGACNGDERADPPGSPAVDSGADASSDAARDAWSYDAAAFPELDPARCPAIEPEQLHGFDPTYALITSGSVQKDKAFYLLTLLEALPDARAQVIADPTLQALATARAQALAAALGSCNGDAACWGEAVRWSDAESIQAADALVALTGSSSALATLVSSHLRKSGHAALHAAGSDVELLKNAWLDAARALNSAWDTQVASLDPVTVEGLLSQAAELDGEPFFAPLLALVLGGLVADGRDEAVRYEPLIEGENRAAVARIPSIDFAAHPFATIVVPGQGPEDPTVVLHPNGRTRSDQGAARWAAGFAPLIVVSGGHVHPDRTPYSEAIEMKKYLMAEHGIAEDAILVDPHARHTTTNLRNVARMLYRYGVPVDRPSLVTSDALQSLYIAAAGETQLFGARCLAELGYFPYRGIAKLDSLDNCWVPAVGSLYSDARDLLDP